MSVSVEELERHGARVLAHYVVDLLRVWPRADVRRELDSLAARLEVADARAEADAAFADMERWRQTTGSHARRQYLRAMEREDAARRRMDEASKKIGGGA